MPQNQIKVLVTGDVIIDHNIYKGQRNVSDSIASLGSHEKRTRGGAGLVYNLLETVFRQKATLTSFGKIVDLHFGFETSVFQRLPQNLRRFGIWKPCSREPGQSYQVWRMIQTLGYGHINQSFFEYDKYINNKAPSKPDILFINDSGLGYRHNMVAKAWPDILNQQNPDYPAWIILKMSRPVAQGDLFRLLTSRFSDRLIIIVAIDGLRREEARITRGISWERTALNLVDEICFNPILQKLLDCRHLIVRIGTEGAVHIQNTNQMTSWLYFDPAFMENEWFEEYPGKALGYMSCFAAGISYPILCDKHTGHIEEGIQAGLSAMRVMHQHGHGPEIKRAEGIPKRVIASDILQPKYSYSKIKLPLPKYPGELSESTYTIITAYLEDVKKNPRPLYGVARRAALLGPKALDHIPYARFGKFFTVDRNEIESLRNIRKMMIHYENHHKGNQPLSIAIFGPPGSGKSFGIKQIAKGVLGKDVPFLEFNLSQLNIEDPSELIGSFHQVRDKVLEGITPVVFWDEFDSKNYLWLQYLLAPMQDGTFQEGQITHPIGKCIFIFAGGTSYTMEHFGPPKNKQKEYSYFKMAKGPDFKSRLSGFLNVLGPNQKQIYDENNDDWIDDPTDVCFPVRRALLMRSMLGIKNDEYLDIDRGLLSAFIEIDKFHHGSRSMSRILAQLQHPYHATMLRSDLPSLDILALHVNHEKFMSIINRDLQFKTKAENLAPYVHEYYRQLGKREGWLRKEMDVGFDALPEEYKEDNRGAAVRIPRVLDLVGLYVVPSSYQRTASEDKISSVIDQNIELLAEMEHNEWTAHKLQNGWRYGTVRDNNKKIHNCLLSYSDLSEQNKEKDRNSVKKYPDILKMAGFKIVSSLDVASIK